MQVRREPAVRSRREIVAPLGVPAEASLEELPEEAQALLEDDPLKASRTVDWATKYQLMQQMANRDGLELEDAKLALVDLQYHDVRPDKGLYYRLAAAGRVERLVAEQEITTAVSEPPTDTRAYFRGRCLAKYAPQIAAARASVTPSALAMLASRKVAAGDIGAVANTIVVMGSERVGNRLGRFVCVVKHRGSAKSDEIAEYRVTGRGIEFV